MGKNADIKFLPAERPMQCRHDNQATADTKHPRQQTGDGTQTKIEQYYHWFDYPASTLFHWVKRLYQRENITPSIRVAPAPNSPAVDQPVKHLGADQEPPCV